jgi:hypothetical protein
MSLVAFGTLSAYQGSGIAAALWGQNLADRNQRQSRDPSDHLDDLTRQITTASNSTIAPMLRKASSVLDGIADMDADSARQALTRLNGVLSQLAAVAPKAGANVSKLAAETIDSLNSRAATLARSLGIYWSDVSVRVSPVTAPGVSGTTSHLVDIYA